MNTKLFKAVDAGHTYQLAHHEATDPLAVETIHFIKKEKGDNTDDIPVMVTVQQGTTNEAVISMLIDRMQHLNELFPSPFNDECIHHLNLAYEALYARTKDREARGVEGTHQA